MITYYHNDDYSSNFFKLGSPDFDLDNTYDMMMMMIMIIALTPTKLSSIELDYTSIWRHKLLDIVLFFVPTVITQPFLMQDYL